MSQLLKLVLIYTLKCNASCNSCCFECDPTITEKMALNDALGLIDDAVSSTEINKVSISGGEALLFEAEVLEILKHCSDYGLETALATNGFWGTTFEVALAKLQLFKSIGLNSLILSSDEFHRNFVPYEFIDNILSANENVGIAITINDVRIKSSLKHPLLEKYNTSDWQVGNCAPIGRAKTNIPYEELIKSVPSGRCIMEDVLSVKPDGSTYPCCSVCNNTKILNLGNIFELSIKEILNIKENLPFLNVITSKGPQLLKEIGERNKIYLKDTKSEYVTMCHLCHTIGNDEAFLSGVEPIIKELATTIQFRKYLKL
jgi:MoaA/NifB/PqqE/SkfB family radical SAM enzyme